MMPDRDLDATADPLPRVERRANRLRLEPTGQRLIRLPDVAQILGVEIRLVRKLIRSGVLPHVMLGERTTRVPEAALYAFLIRNHTAH